MIDSHCHLADSAFASDRDTVIARARDAGVSPMIVICDTLEEGVAAHALTQKHDDLFCTVGVHPHHASHWNSESAHILHEWMGKGKVVGLGEIGLDYHYDHSPRDVQMNVFEEQLSMAKELGKPVVLHTREAIEDTWSIVKNISPEKLVVHCCTEKFEDVERFVNAGYLLSFTGIATYPKSDEIRRTIVMCPIEQILIETDAPFLAPIPHRGKRNEPAFVTEVAKCIAKIKGISLQEVDERTTKNTQEFFQLPV